MKKVFPFFLLLLCLVHSASCERDDICVEGDTPLLVIGFFDIEDTLNFKAVPSFRLRALDNDAIFNNNTLYGFSDRATENDSILVPLRIAENTTSFEFIMNSADDETTGAETGTEETLNLSYIVNSEFISRACGFIANYNELQIEQVVNASSWIQDISIETTDIERTNQIHVKIFH